eukprot:TRINITY_DN21545_c0_g1_i1.p2 TRINITY_DN21545_c0_g1~~TRINITY_DN21545_c0_g1_i1.p2  ORF type:complete len:129 (-),score=38.61 TRINITY_DN21545_c0_g1_i1:566-952(-)
MLRSLVGSEMCIRDRDNTIHLPAQISTPPLATASPPLPIQAELSTSPNLPAPTDEPPAGQQESGGQQEQIPVPVRRITRSVAAATNQSRGSQLTREESSGKNSLRRKRSNNPEPQDGTAKPAKRTRGS